jgi:hypothetical protein
MRQDALTYINPALSSLGYVIGSMAKNYPREHDPGRRVHVLVEEGPGEALYLTKVVQSSRSSATDT